MQIGDPAVVASTAVPPYVAVTPARAPDPRPTERGKGETRRDGAAGFRAALDAATGDIAGSTSERPAATESNPVPPPRPERRRSEVIELDGREAAALYGAARARAAKTEPQADIAKPAFNAAPQVFYSASRQYAARYFSVGSGFAVRGETLELSA